MNSQLLRHASAEIRSLRKRNEILAAQVAVIETIRACVMGPPQHGGMAEDLAWVLDQTASEMEADKPKTPDPAPNYRDPA